MSPRGIWRRGNRKRRKERVMQHKTGRIQGNDSIPKKQKQKTIYIYPNQETKQKKGASEGISSLAYRQKSPSTDKGASTAHQIGVPIRKGAPPSSVCSNYPVFTVFRTSWNTRSEHRIGREGCSSARRATRPRLVRVRGRLRRLGPNHPLRGQKKMETVYAT